MVFSLGAVICATSVLGWIVAGLLAGAIAGRITRGRGYGCCRDIILGLIGAVIGGFLVSLFVHGTVVVNFIGTTIVALIGAVALILALRLIRAAV
jgi:uncharacterized membrane protein YeaQ/YmgE (transglycosylase-associated protein family)